MNYEAKIGNVWYPVEVIQRYMKAGIYVADVYVKGFMGWDGAGATITDRSRTVLWHNVRATTDEPLEVAYPKEN